MAPDTRIFVYALVILLSGPIIVTTIMVTSAIIRRIRRGAKRPPDPP